MTLKKLAVAGAAAALLMTSAMPAFASHTTVTNHGNIDNNSWQVVNTGFNYASGRHSDVRTGNAVAFQSTDNEINTVAGCGCASGRHSSTTVTNSGDVNNTSVQVVNTGVNATGHGDVRTGNAVAGQDVYNVVGTGVSSL